MTTKGKGCYKSLHPCSTQKICYDKKRNETITIRNDDDPTAPRSLCPTAQYPETADGTTTAGTRYPFRV